MSGVVFIGLDCGSTSLKLAAFDLVNGSQLAFSNFVLPWQRKASGACELDSTLLNGLVVQGLADIVQQLGDRANQVAGITCVGHGGGFYAIDRHGAVVNGHVVSSTDQRSNSLLNELDPRRQEELKAKVGCGSWAGQPTMIAKSIAREEGAQLSTGQVLFFAKDYITKLLTGQTTTDYTDATTAGLLATGTGLPEDMAFSVVGLEPWSSSTLARLRSSGEKLGEVLTSISLVTGLPKHVPVFMGAIDLYAGMLGVGATSAGDAAAVFGTWCVNAVVGPEGCSISGNTPGVSNVVLLNAELARLYMNNTAASMANISWLANTLSFADSATAVNVAFESPAGANGLRYIPHINGGPGGMGAQFIGLRAYHTRPDLARAVLEAVVALHARNLMQLQRCGLTIERLFAIGGGSSDIRLVEMLAAMTGFGICTPGIDETGARGAAILAARTLGLEWRGLVARHRTVSATEASTNFYKHFLSEFNTVMDKSSGITEAKN
jgi:L-xylulokinase